MEVAVGQGVEVGVYFVGANVGGEFRLDFAAQVKAKLVLGNALGGVSGEDFVGLMVKASEEGVFEAVPHLLAGGHGVAKGQQSQKVEVFAFLDKFREGLDYLRIFDVPSLRDEGHCQMLIDQEAQRLGVFGGQSEPLGGALGDGRAGARMVERAAASRLAGVVQDKREIEQIGTVQAFQKLFVVGMRRFGGFQDLIQVFQTDDGVFVGGVDVIEFVLHLAGQFAEFRNVFAQQSDFMHGSQSAGDVAFLVEDFDEGLSNVGVSEEVAIGQSQLGSDGVCQVGTEAQAALLGVAEHAHQSARLFFESSGVGQKNLPVLELEAIHEDGFSAFQKVGYCFQSAVFLGECHALFDGAAEEVNVSQVGVDFVHEGFQSSGGRAIRESKRVGDAGLEDALEHFFGAVGEVVHFVSNAKEIIIGGGQLAVFRWVDYLVLQQVFHSAASFFEEGHPKEVLIVPQAAAAVLDVWLLHIGGIAEFFATQFLISKPSGNVGFFPPMNAFGQQGLRHFVEKRFVSGDEAGFNQGGLGLHVFVGNVNAIRDRPRDGENLEPNIGERAKESLAKIDQPLMFSAGRQAWAVVKHHDVQVTARA